MTSGSLPSPNPKPWAAVCCESVTPGMTPTGGKQHPWAQEGEPSALTHPTDKVQQRLFSHFISRQHGNRMPIKQRKHTGLRNWCSREAHSRWRAGHRQVLQRHATSPLPSLADTWAVVHPVFSTGRATRQAAPRSSPQDTLEFAGNRRQGKDRIRTLTSLGGTERGEAGRVGERHRRGQW